MAKRRSAKSRQDQNIPSIDALQPGGDKQDLTLVLLSDNAAVTNAVAAALSHRDVTLVSADSIAEVGEAVTRHRADLAMIDVRLLDQGAQTIVQNLVSAASCPIALISETPNLEQALGAFQLGAIDFLVGPFAGEGFSPAGFQQRLERCLRRSLSGHVQEQRLRKLKHVCRDLNSARREMTQQLDSLCNDMVSAYHGLAQQMTQVTLASEFQAMVRQELDIESCLRSVLEFILSVSGPTNAAVFLPSNQLDFSLGAYVNYDLPRDSLDVLLDHLADVIPGRVHDDMRVLEHASNEALRAWLGDDAAWIEDSHLITFTCRHEEECLAVVVLFRDQTHPFASELTEKMATIAPIFGGQLARIIRVHNRIGDDHDWHGFDSDDDAGDLAA